jgi:acetyl esterase/lipase
VLGFSAGGHLAAALSNNFEKRTYPRVDKADDVSCRPDFALLIYPAYLTEKDGGDNLASELRVTGRTPPTFLVQTEDDPVKVENSLVYYSALKRAGVPAEMHIYAKGGHGYGLRKGSDAVTRWPQLATEWLRSFGLLSRPGS